MNRDEIKVRTYIVNDNKVFIVYSADWCGPCQRIKPYVYNYMKDCIYEDSVMNKIDFVVISKTIPFFAIKSESGNETLQSSDYNTLKKFLEKNNVTINTEIDVNIDF
jgi:thiol-disulfide isomerase/thioredoxin